MQAQLEVIRTLKLLHIIKLELRPVHGLQCVWCDNINSVPLLGVKPVIAPYRGCASHRFNRWF